MKSLYYLPRLICTLFIQSIIRDCLHFSRFICPLSILCLVLSVLQFPASTTMCKRIMWATNLMHQYQQQISNCVLFLHWLNKQCLFFDNYSFLEEETGGFLRRKGVRRYVVQQGGGCGNHREKREPQTHTRTHTHHAHTRRHTHTHTHSFGCCVCPAVHNPRHLCNGLYALACVWAPFTQPLFYMHTQTHTQTHTHARSRTESHTHCN